MAYSAFVDKAHIPSLEEIQACLASQWHSWQSLTGFVEDNYQCKAEFINYGKNYGWAVRYKKAGKALIAFYPGVDSFIVQVIFSDADMQQAQAAGIGGKILEIFNAANPYSEGRWLFIPIQSVTDLEDVKKMLAIKAPIKHPKVH